MAELSMGLQALGAASVATHLEGDGAKVGQHLELSMKPLLDQHLEH